MPERLQKVLAQAGVASRRQAEDMILEGRVRVNGHVVRELGTQVEPETDQIQADGKPVRIENKVYVILHKPRGYLSDRDETADKPSALELVSSKERLYAAGRLDANSEGLLLLTNDGALAFRVTHPRYEHEKEYLVLVEGKPTEQSMDRMVKGVHYGGERFRADSVEIVKRLGEMARKHHWKEAQGNETWLRVVLHEGKKREIRHMCASLGYPVKRLIRVRIGPVELGDLPVGKFRDLDLTKVKELSQAKLRKR